jgi:hypothetical protein
MKCFVIMPFGNLLSDPDRRRQLDLLYDGLIKPAVESVRIPGRPEETIACHRGDKEARPGEIISHIVENLVEADISIADLSGRNPNVFYELGVRHAVNDNTILIAQSEDDIPFDLRGQRLIIYRCDFEGSVQLRTALVHAIEDVLLSPKRVDNPVRRYLYDREKEKIQAKGTPPGYDVVKELLGEVEELRRDFKEQTVEVRRIMAAITSSAGKSTVDQSRPADLAFFEGVWRDDVSGSLFCARLIDGELVMPYCWEGSYHLTGRFFDFNLIGTSIFARFEWLSSQVTSGYGTLKIESQNRLQGGWWNGCDVPADFKGDYTQIGTANPNMNKLQLTRMIGRAAPSWAEDYFNTRATDGA